MNTNYDHFEVIFADNASTDGSLEYAQEQFGQNHRLKIIKNKKNLGFAKGNNVGASMAKGKYIAFLNIDTVVEPDWLKEFVNVMETDPAIGVCQSKLLSLKNPDLFDSAGDFIDYYGIMMRRGGDFMEKNERQYNKIEEVFSARGAAMMIRQRIIKEVGLFDPVYFATYEDIDFCWRARLHGYKVLYVPKSTVYHAGGAASSASLRAFFTTRNWIMTLIKNYELRNLVRFSSQVITISILATMAELITMKQPKLALERLRGILWNLLNFKRTWRKRLKIQHHLRKVPDSQIMQHMLKANLAISLWLPLWRKYKH